MKIGGLLKFTLIDFPGRPAAVIFTQGCNLRCCYCHNPELVYPHLFLEPMLQEEVLAFLKRRQGTLEGVVVTGGEPTLQEDLIPFLCQLKALGYAVKLDTNGARPEVLRQILAEKLVDYVAMDLKAPLESYDKVTGVKVNTAALSQSIDLIKNAGVAHEFRTTYDKQTLTEEDINTLRTLAAPSVYKVQECLPVPKEKASLKVQK